MTTALREWNDMIDFRRIVFVLSSKSFRRLDSTKLAAPLVALEHLKLTEVSSSNAEFLCSVLVIPMQAIMEFFSAPVRTDESSLVAVFRSELFFALLTRSCSENLLATVVIKEISPVRFLGT